MQLELVYCQKTGEIRGLWFTQLVFDYQFFYSMMIKLGQNHHNDTHAKTVISIVIFHDRKRKLLVW